MKELVHGGFNIQSIKKPCWLVFKHTGTNDFCCIGKVDLEHQKLSDVINFENNKTVIRSYRDWNEIMTNYIENVNCYSNEGNKWMKSNIKLVEKELTIEFREPFLPRRGRINCSVNDNGKWRWFGTQFIIR
mgnify:CR=1 FL=1